MTHSPGDDSIQKPCVGIHTPLISNSYPETPKRVTLCNVTSNPSLCSAPSSVRGLSDVQTLPLCAGSLSITQIIPVLVRATFSEIPVHIWTQNQEISFCIAVPARMSRHLAVYLFRSAHFESGQHIPHSSLQHVEVQAIRPLLHLRDRVVEFG